MIERVRYQLPRIDAMVESWRSTGTLGKTTALMVCNDDAISTRRSAMM